MVAWHLEPSALEVLRDELVARGRWQVPAPARQSVTNAALRGAAVVTPPALQGGDAPENNALLARLSPFMELLFLMIAADGEYHAGERDLLRGVARTFAGSELADEAIDQWVQSFDVRLRISGVDECLSSVATRLTADRHDAELAFTLTATVALADGAIGEPEQAMLTHLAEVLGISRARARELVAARPHPAHRLQT